MGCAYNAWRVTVLTFLHRSRRASFSSRSGSIMDSGTARELLYCTVPVVVTVPRQFLNCQTADLRDSSSIVHEVGFHACTGCFRRDVTVILSPRIGHYNLCYKCAKVPQALSYDRFTTESASHCAPPVTGLW